MAVVTARYHPPRVTSGGAGEHRRYGERMSPVTSPRVVLQGASRDNLVREFELDYTPHIHADAVIGWAWSVFNNFFIAFFF